LATSCCLLCPSSSTISTAAPALPLSAEPYKPSKPLRFPLPSRTARILQAAVGHCNSKVNPPCRRRGAGRRMGPAPPICLPAQPSRDSAHPLPGFPVASAPVVWRSVPAQSRDFQPVNAFGCRIGVPRSGDRREAHHIFAGDFCGKLLTSERLFCGSFTAFGIGDGATGTGYAGQADAAKERERRRKGQVHDRRRDHSGSAEPAEASCAAGSGGVRGLLESAARLVLLAGQFGAGGS